MMNFEINQSLEILERTPAVLETWLSGISENWVHGTEGKNTWSPYIIVGHLIHGEKTDWLPRAKIILSHSSTKIFEPFDRFAQLHDQPNKSLVELLSEFKVLRQKNLQELRSFNLNSDQLDLKGIHPELGEVRLRELLSTWVVHDLGHIAQISRVMAKQYSTEVGPWKAYLGILSRHQ